MLKSIWKGIKWFFSVKEKTHNSISTKHNHVVRQSPPEAPPMKVNDSVMNETQMFMSTYNSMVDVYADKSNGKLDDVIEGAKRGLWVPHGITEDHKRLILANCGFQKTVQTKDGFDYDPRLIQAINYAMNMYSAEVSQQVERIIRQSSIVE